MKLSPASLDNLVANLQDKGEFSDKRIVTAESLIEHGGTKVYQVMLGVIKDTDETHEIRYEIASILTMANNHRVAAQAERMLSYLDWEADDHPDKGKWEG